MDELLETIAVDGRSFEVYGLFDDQTPDGEFDSYDVFENGELINEGDTFFERPTEASLRDYLHAHSR